MLERKALLETLEQHRCIVTIPLRTDLSVGTLIQLQLPAAQPPSKGDVSDKLNDDRYLITDISINGSPNLGIGEMVLECSKESFNNKIASVEPLAKVEVTKSIPN